MDSSVGSFLLRGLMQGHKTVKMLKEASQQKHCKVGHKASFHRGLYR